MDADDKTNRTLADIVADIARRSDEQSQDLDLLRKARRGAYGGKGGDRGAFRRDCP
jgi:hypothetical protein